MSIEIERKFLVRAESLPPLGEGVPMSQAYLGLDPVVRVRVAGQSAFLTVKGPGLVQRAEVEAPLPLDAARELFTLRLPGSRVVQKTRHLVEHGGKNWEVDIFSGELAGLALAEIELQSPEEPVALPPWADREVSEDPRYQNVNLARWGKPA